MADSDNTTALPFVIPEGRRMCCAVDDDTKDESSVGASPAEHMATRLLGTVDPCVVLLQEWEQARHMAVVLCRLQQRLETRIRNALKSSDLGGEPVETGTATVANRQARWDALDQEVGYSRVRAAELEAIEAQEQILETATATHAQSLRGIIAKLRIIVGGGESVDDPTAFPWPQIQSALADLKELSGRDADVLSRSADRGTGDNEPGGKRGLDGGSNRRRASMLDGDPAIESPPQQS